MSAKPLYYVWDYRDVDRAFWEEHLADWLPRRIVDAHTHIMAPEFRREPMTEPMRRQYWVNEVLEPIAADVADRGYETVFPDREVSCVAFGMPDLAYDLEGGNDYVRRECVRRGWHSLAVVPPQWLQAKVVELLAGDGVLGVKPYYSLIGENRETRDAHLEAGIFDFLPHHVLEVLNDRGAWVTLHVPKAARLGHPDNLREIRELRRRYPDVVLVIAHLGRCYTEPHALEALPALAEDPGVYFDTSAVLNPACHRVALERIGVGRIVYGTDNPVMYMRGRRQYSGRGYVNRTNHDFHFNREREAPEVEAAYTLYLYEDLRALRQACDDLGITSRGEIEALFHDNAARLIAGVLRHRLQ